MTTAYSFTRMSTPAQMKGDSQRRQLAKAERYAEAKGMLLDTSLRAIGISAFRGEHRRKGALALFLAKIESGEVVPGDYLIVENIDRLSRENSWDALDLMRSIINAGVIVVSLIDDMEYSLISLRSRPEVITTLQAALTKGHRESRDKADRLQEVWAEKRAAIVAGGRKRLTRQGPGWFRLIPDDPSEPLVGDWEFTDNCNSGRLAFQWCIDGLGKETISRKLNELGCPSFKHGDGWQASTVGLLLSDRRAIGELQFYSKSGGNGRQPVGAPISGYFATASGETLVSEETFYLAQRAIAKRHCGAGVGRLSKVPNIFVGVAKCYCGRTMEYRDKRTSFYLICSGAQRKHACTNKQHFSYSKTETLVLDWVDAIQVPDDEAHRAGVAGITLSAKVAERDDLKRRFNEAMAEWGSSTVPMIKDHCLKCAERHADEIAAVEVQIAELQHTVETTKRSVIDERRATVCRARAEMASLTGQALYEARAKLASALRHVIDHVEFEAEGKFAVYLHGSTKAYRFAAGEFSHLIDVEDSNWMRLPTASQKKAMTESIPFQIAHDAD